MDRQWQAGSIREKKGPQNSRHMGRAPRNDNDSASWQMERAIGNAGMGMLLQARLAIGAAGDHYEQEADRIADQVTSGRTASAISPGSSAVIRRSCAACSAGVPCATCAEKAAQHTPAAPAITPVVQGKLESNAARSLTPRQQGVIDGLRGGGSPLPPSARDFMEPRFGRDFSAVRIHTDARAAESAQSIGAHAYTVGRDVVFGMGRFTPDTLEGRRLLAHELTHVVQQTGGPSPGIVQRKPDISVADKDFIGPLDETHVRAGETCPITCCGQMLGTVQAMPLVYHIDRIGKNLEAGDNSATGIGAALHYIALGTQPGAGDRCHCDDFHFIQVVETNNPAPDRGNVTSFVDNAHKPTPFFFKAGGALRGRHEIPETFAEAGKKTRTTESLYDLPYRQESMLGTTSLEWKAEACISCIKKTGPDRVLGCVTYGFTRRYDPKTLSFRPVRAMKLGCLASPSPHFIDTLRNDPTTSNYSFKPAPEPAECSPDDKPVAPKP